jgi:hypothetical protein
MACCVVRGGRVVGPTVDAVMCVVQLLHAVVAAVGAAAVAVKVC